MLKSGRRSDWFIDAKQTTCRPDGMLLVADALLAVLPDDVTAIGGLTMGADAAAFATAGIAATRGRSSRRSACARRSRTTAAGGRVAGALDPGDRVAITEDAVTRGVSMLEAAEVVRAAAPSRCCWCRWSTGAAPWRPWPPRPASPSAALVTAPDLGFPYGGRGGGPGPGQAMTSRRICSGPGSARSTSAPAATARAGGPHLAGHVDPTVPLQHEVTVEVDRDPLCRRGERPHELDGGQQERHPVGGLDRRGRGQLDVDAHLLAQALGLAGKRLGDLVGRSGGHVAVGRAARPPPTPSAG